MISVIRPVSAAKHPPPSKSQLVVMDVYLVSVPSGPVGLLFFSPYLTKV